jgi:2',3'-cyclic-nucleotide 2'-phosphodiesterase (5'-nucleotidase family)
MRRSARVTLAVLLVVVLGVSGCGVLRRSPATPDLVKLTFLQLNDIYTLDPVDDGRRGGMARLATLVKDLRSKNPNTLFALGGDFLSPSILSTYLRGRQMVVAFNELGLDVVTFGNHEFDFGPAVLAERMRESRFAWVSSNVRDRRTGGAFGGAQHDRLVTLGGLRVGLLGLTIADTAHNSSPGPDVLFEDPLRIGVETATALRHRGAQVVVAVTHLDMDTDRALGDKAAIDLILGGHEHEPLIAESSRAIVTKAGSDGRYLVQVDLWLTRAGKIVERSWTFHEVSARIAPDPAMEKLVAGFAAQLDRELGAVVGRTEVALDARRSILRTQETGIGDFVTDVMRAAHGADAAFINGGGIRGDRVFAPGDLTRRNVFELLPFTNTVLKLELTGEALRQTLEHGLAQADNQSGGFLQMSGVQLQFNPAAPAGRRITTITVGGQPLDPARRYSVAVVNFLANGGDGHTAFRNARVLVRETDAPDLATLVLRAIEVRKTIAPAVEGRIRPVAR